MADKQPMQADGSGTRPEQDGPDGNGELDQGEFTLLSNFYWINYTQHN